MAGNSSSSTPIVEELSAAGQASGRARGFHPMDPASFVWFLSSVDRRRSLARRDFTRLGRASQLLWAGEDSRGRGLATWLVGNSEADRPFDRRRSWKRLLDIDPGPAGGVLFLFSSTLAGPRHADVARMREALAARRWELRFGTDARPIDIAWVARDPLVRPLMRDIRRRWKVEIHPASESPSGEMSRLHPHGWIDGEFFRIGLTFDPKPHDLGHELMHLLLYEQGYPDAVPFADGTPARRDQIMLLLCGLLDVEVDRRLAERGFGIVEEAVEHARHAINDELPPNLTELDHTFMGLARLRDLPEDDLRRRYIRWAKQAHRESFAIAVELDRLLPRTLSPEDIATAILVVADRFGIDPGFMPAPATVSGRGDVPTWSERIRAKARAVGAPTAPIDRLTTEWETRPIDDNDWPVRLPSKRYRQRAG
jgi:hypothetical protein